MKIQIFQFLVNLKFYDLYKSLFFNYLVHMNKWTILFGIVSLSSATWRSFLSDMVEIFLKNNKWIGERIITNF